MIEPNSQQLVTYISRWDLRWRFSLLATWVPRGVLAGLTVGLAAAVISRVRPVLFPSQVMIIAGAAVLIGAVVSVIAVMFWPRPTLAKARHFDRVFGLKERTSTALELTSGAIKAPDQFVDLQLKDALNRASAVKAGQYLRARWQRRELIMMVIVLALLVAAILLVNPQTPVLAAQTNVANTIKQEVQQLQQVQNNVQSNTALSDAEKAQLNKILQDTINQLKQPNITQPEAVAALTQAEQQLGNSGTQLTQQQQQAAKEAASDLGTNQTTQSVGQALQNGNLGAAANQLQNLAQKAGAGQLTSQQMSDAASALSQAANNLQSVNPQAADAMRQAANAMRQGDTAAAQKALDQAANALSQQQQQMNQTSLSQAAQQASQQAQQGQQQVAQAGQQGQQSQQQGQQGQQSQQQQNQQGNSSQANSQQGQQGQQGQQSQQQQSGSGQNSQQSQQASNSQSGSQQSGDGQSQPQQGQGQQSQSQMTDGQQPGDQQGNQSGDQQGGQQQAADGQMSGDQQGQGNMGSQSDGGMNNPNGSSSVMSDQNPNGGGGAGQGKGGAGDDTTGRQAGQAQPFNLNNGHGDGQVTSPEKIYAPSFMGGSGGQKITPGNDNTRPNPNDPVQQGQFSNNPVGQSTVPLGSVANQAASDADHAMDADHVPGALRGVIREYFTGLQGQ